MAKIREKSGGGGGGGGIKKSKKGSGSGAKANIRAARYFSSLAAPPPPKSPTVKSDGGGGGAGDKSPKKTPKKKQFRKNNNDDDDDDAEKVQLTEPSEDVKKRITSFKQSKTKQAQQKALKMLVKLSGKWYQEDLDDKAVKPKLEETSPHQDDDVKPTIINNISNDTVFKLRKSAEGLLENDCQAYRQACLHGEQKADFHWMEKMMKIGTLPDKMAAYVVKIQDSPVHNIHHLQNLISMVKVQSKQQCIMAADTLKDLFLEDLLPPSRKLIGFEKRRNSLSQASKVQLIMWIYEDRLKMCYNSFLDALRRMSLDNVDKVRAKAVVLMFNLLTTHPEHEAELLQMLVNKLGDPIKKVGSRALFYLNSLLANHPRMKIVVIDEVERLLFRNNIAKRAQYYGVCFLNTINLEDEHPEVACKLINVYVAFFKGCIKTGDIDSKMMSGLLTGLNKAYPLAKEYGFQFSENADTLYKIVHMSSFNIGIQALSILFQLTDPQNRPSEADRFYRALYNELLRPEIAVTSYSTHFLNLVFKSMKHDNNIGRVMGFCKRLMQICQSVPPNLACAILFLLSEVSKTQKNIIRVRTAAEEALREEEMVSDDESNDPSDDESKAKESRNAENMNNLIKRSNVQMPEENSSIEKPKKTLLGLSGRVPVINKQLLLNKPDGPKDDDITLVEVNGKAPVKIEYKNQLNDYDPSARNPLYSGAEFSLSHEIVTLIDHYHPSVALFAKKLLQKGYIVYEGNPLKDFTITRFLERFVYKNPKKPKVTPGVPRTYHPKGLRNIPVNSNDYLKNEESKIPEEEKFFYRYFTEKKAEKLDAPDDVDSDTESVGDEEFDELMDNYFKSSKGKDADEDDFDVDFAANLQNTKLSGKKQKKGEADSESEEEIDDQSDQDSEEDEFGPADDADEMMEFDDDDDLDFEDEDGVEVFEADDEEMDIPIKKKKMKKAKGDDMFAPAEEFAEMLEANADFSLSGPGTLINKDNADPKQLHWEMERDRWMKGYKGRSKTIFKNKRKR